MTLSDHQRFTLIWTILSSLIRVIVETDLLAEKDAE